MRAALYKSRVLAHIFLIAMRLRNGHGFILENLRRRHHTTITPSTALYYRKRPQPQAVQIPARQLQNDNELPEGSYLSESSGAWEKWEFGDETFIDTAMERIEDHADGDDASKKAFLDNDYHHGNQPLRDGVPDYPAAISCLRPFLSEDRMNKMEAVLNARSGRCRFVIEDPINPSNAWACLRTLDSFGVQYVDVIANLVNYREGSDNPRYRKMRTAMGTQKWLDMSQYGSTEDCIRGLKADGWTILATDLSPGAVPISDMDFSQVGKFAVVMGNEERGITEEMRGLADQCVYLPMRGFAQSFSLSVGCAAIASHLDTCGALRCAPGREGENGNAREGSNPPLWGLEASEKDRILFRWSMDSIKGSRQILRRNGFDIPARAPQRNNILNFSTK